MASRGGAAFGQFLSGAAGAAPGAARLGADLRQLRERKASLAEEIQNWEKTLNLLKQHDEDNPRIPILVDKLVQARIGNLGLDRGPVPGIPQPRGPLGASVNQFVQGRQQRSLRGRQMTRELAETQRRAEIGFAQQKAAESAQISQQTAAVKTSEKRIDLIVQQSISAYKRLRKEKEASEGGAAEFFDPLGIRRKTNWTPAKAKLMEQARQNVMKRRGLDLETLTETQINQTQQGGVIPSGLQGQDLNIPGPDPLTSLFGNPPTAVPSSTAVSIPSPGDITAGSPDEHGLIVGQTYSGKDGQRRYLGGGRFGPIL